jgi:hypothetical protein
VFTLIIAVGYLFRMVDYHEPERAAIREAGEWLRGHGAEGKTVVATYDGVAYYARSGMIRPQGGEGVLRLVSGGTGDYLALEETELEEMPAEVQEEIRGSPQLEFLARFGEPGRGVLVYRIRP